MTPKFFSPQQNIEIVEKVLNSGIKANAISLKMSRERKEGASDQENAEMDIDFFANLGKY